MYDKSLALDIVESMLDFINKVINRTVNIKVLMIF